MGDKWYEYYEWLKKYIIGVDPDLYIYNKLLWQLHNHEFRIKLKNDKNRIEDAVELRLIFGHIMENHPISVFEVMVALASRAEQSIMHDDILGDRTSRWFWSMIDSMGLTYYTDDDYKPKEVGDILTRLIQRRYAPNGAGGLFTVRPPHGDMRRMEIWDQLCLYLDDVLADEGIIGIR